MAIRLELELANTSFLQDVVECDMRGLHVHSVVSSLPDSEYLDAQHNSLEYFLAPLEEVMEFHWKMF